MLCLRHIFYLMMHFQKTSETVISPRSYLTIRRKSHLHLWWRHDSVMARGGCKGGGAATAELRWGFSRCRYKFSSVASRKTIPVRDSVWYVPSLGSFACSHVLHLASERANAPPRQASFVIIIRNLSCRSAKQKRRAVSGGEMMQWRMFPAILVS